MDYVYGGEKNRSRKERTETREDHGRPEKTREEQRRPGNGRADQGRAGKTREDQRRPGFGKMSSVLRPYAVCSLSPASAVVFS